MERSILEWSLRALLMALGTAAVVSAVRVRAASVLHRAWTAAMIAMLLLPAWTAWGPTVTAPVLPAVQQQAEVEPLVTRETAGTAGPAMAQVTPRVAARPDPSAPLTSQFPWRQTLFGIYLAGLAVMLVRLIRGTLQIRRMLRAVSHLDGVASSPLCSAPVTVGWLRPVLLLPEGWQLWSAEKLEVVLAHEREHARRRDPLVQWLALLNRCCFWFHPLAWWLERKLATLAEEACDAAVLSCGHAPHDYAHCLIEMARSVTESGARLRSAGAVCFSAGNLPRRIRRIMDAPADAPASRVKSIVVAGLCVPLLVAALACNVVRPKKHEVKITEAMWQEAREKELHAQAQKLRRLSESSIWLAARHLSPDGARQLDSAVKAHPEDPDKLLELIRYYESKNDFAALDALTFWYIEQHPDLRIDWGYRPTWDKVWDQDGYDHGRQLWMAELKKSWTPAPHFIVPSGDQLVARSEHVYMNAAEYLSGNDKELAEQILQEGQRKFTSPALHWEVFLGRLYAGALAESPSPYAQEVRKKLLASNDVELLTRTVEQLQLNRTDRELARPLVERALELRPNDARARRQRDTLRRMSAGANRSTDLGHLSDSDRMVLLAAQLRRRDSGDAQTIASELLELAARNPKDPDSGTAVFYGNMALGEAAVKHGDKPGAVSHLAAAGDATPTEFLRYNQIDMSLAHELMNAGERQAVATFLERCATFNQAEQPLAAWAEQIRKGRRPELMPFSNYGTLRLAYCGNGGLCR